jgi:hypothetical protein
MTDCKQIVRQSGDLIENSELKHLLLPLWRLIEWQVHPGQPGVAAELDRQGNAVIHLYPDLAAQPGADRIVLREFGSFVLGRAGERGAAIWQSKLDVPTAEQISSAKRKLEDPELRRRCRRYQDMLDTYPDKGSSVDRLVFINLMNALLANNIAYPDSQGVDILAWGPTTEYANLRKYHCLVPLVSAYTPALVAKDYGHALAALLADGLAEVRESSVAFALRGIVQRIARMASPA